MVKKFYVLVLLLGLFVNSFLRADEGMWIPLLLEKYNIADMQDKGFRLSAEDIYSINKACLKDAIVIFGGFCTAELISDQGLIITNHHCGLGRIQSHSSLEHNYIKNGFWAMSQEEELTNPGLYVTFLVRMEDVTSQVLADVKEKMTEEEKQNTIREAILEIISQAKQGNSYDVDINPFYYGNEYYMFVYESYNDIRLVGAPPSAIGKFGGDTDNWMWPRHTGDFSLFRIYADTDNKPAQYSPDNVPYLPKKHFPISLKGVKEGDFTLVFGYPGSTQQFITSFAVEMITQVSNPHKIKLRGKVLEVMDAAMNESQDTRIKYFSKASGVSNAWKKWQGENRGLERLNAIKKKKELEEIFTKWAASDRKREKKYGDLLPTFEKYYDELKFLTVPRDYRREAGLRIELISFVSRFERLIGLTTDSDSPDVYSRELNRVKNNLESFFKDYYKPIDVKVMAELLRLYYENVDKEFLPDIFSEIENNYKLDFSQYADFVFSNSIFADEEKTITFFETYTASSANEISKDPAYVLYKSIESIYREKVSDRYNELNREITRMYKTYVAGLMEMQEDKVFYPDANFTLRVAYGKVDGFYPRDAVHYNYYTTLEGIIEKDNPEIFDYDVPVKLKTLYENKDYGIYGEDNKMNVCFSASNHTTGGNSGSPVLDADGYLIGINFDRCWEGTMSDIMFDPDRCRNISLDIRFALFIIDKFAGAGYLLDEMTLITD